MRSISWCLGTAALFLVGVPAAQAQLGTSAATDRLRTNIMRGCDVPGTMVQVFQDRGGPIRIVRSPTLSPDQNECVDTYDGTANGRTLRDNLTRRRRVRTDTGE